MDTRFWGPSAWRLLHLVSFSTTETKKTCDFFNLLPYLLPCKYCRTSLSGFILKNPVDCAVRERRLPRWLWRIHNSVNEKLGVPKPYPPFSAVEKIYTERLNYGCTRTTFDGWDFLFSVAENHPYSRLGLGSEPIEDAPSPDGLSDLERNKWNLLSCDEKYEKFVQFWNILPDVLPFPEWREAWRKHDSGHWSTRADAIRTLWKIRSGMEKDMELLNKTSYSSLCKVLQENRASRGRTLKKKHTST